MFSVLNIVTGVFVENAIQHAAADRDIKIDREKKKLESISSEVRDLMIELDVNGDNQIEEAEFVEGLKKDSLQMLFKHLGIDASDLPTLWQELDTNKDGAVDLDEFMRGCMAINAHGKSAGIQTQIANLGLQSKNQMVSLAKKTKSDDRSCQQ